MGKTPQKLALAGFLGLCAGVFVRAQEPSQQVFRGRVALVPVDVRVLDREGQSVRDLTIEDFVVHENGVPQHISLFETEDYAREAVLMSPTSPGASASIPEAKARTFVIVLGRGRLQGPARGFDALLEFVDGLAMPSDRIAIAAYDRVSELTTDRARVRRFVEEYRNQHEHIEALLDHWFRGLTAFYGSSDPPPGIQERIEKLFRMPGLPRFRALELLPVANRGFFDGDLPTPDENEDDVQENRSFVFNTAAGQDLEKLYAVVNYLRLIDGEKHVILLTPEGLRGVMKDTSDRLVRMANDARVTLSTIQTGGLPTRWVRTGSSRFPVSRFDALDWRHVWANADTKTRAERTGGIASLYEFADKTFERIERATRFQYILGYYPSNPNLDGRYREITVKVDRKDVQVLHRYGYHARKEPIGLDRREYVTESRLAAAASYRAVIKDLPLTLAAEASVGAREVRVQIRIAPEALQFIRREGRHIASVDVAIYAGDRGEQRIGMFRKRIDLSLTPESYGRITRDGVMFSATVPVSAEPHFVKAIVYEYASDRLGSAVVSLDR